MDKIDYYYKNAMARIHQTQEGERLDVNFIYRDKKTTQISRRITRNFLNCVPLSLLEFMAPSVDWREFKLQTEIDSTKSAHLYHSDDHQTISVGKGMVNGEVNIINSKSEEERFNFIFFHEAGHALQLNFLAQGNTSLVRNLLTDAINSPNPAPLEYTQKIQNTLIMHDEMYADCYAVLMNPTIDVAALIDFRLQENVKKGDRVDFEHHMTVFALEELDKMDKKIGTQEENHSLVSQCAERGILRQIQLDCALDSNYQFNLSTNFLEFHDLLGDQKVSVVDILGPGATENNKFLEHIKNIDLTLKDLFESTEPHDLKPIITQYLKETLQIKPHIEEPPQMSLVDKIKLNREKSNKATNIVNSLVSLPSKTRRL